MSRKNPNSKRVENPRQKILDYIRAHPNCLTYDILYGAMPGYSIATVINSMREMEKNGEVSRTKDLGIVGTPYRYTALVKHASPPSRQKSRELPDDIDRPAKPSVCKPGHYINVCGQHDYKSQGGQSNSHQPRGFASCMIVA